VDRVWFDVGDNGVCEELLRRAEADWRYNATDQEVIRALHRKIMDLMVQRQRERERGEEKLAQIGEQNKRFRIKVSPQEGRIYRLKEELADHIEETKTLLKANIQRKTLLPKEIEALEDERQLRELYEIEFRMLEKNLTRQRREVTESIESKQQELDAIQRSIEGTAKSNESCRRQLHAMRFETETERFGPGASVFGNPSVARQLHEAKVFSTDPVDWGPMSWNPRQTGETRELYPQLGLTGSNDFGPGPPLPGSVPIEA